jgi:gluconate kinase
MKVTFFFGEMGSGKNYHGEGYAKLVGGKFLDGDTLLPPNMVARVSKFLPLTSQMVDDFVYIHLLGGILDESRDSKVKHLVVAQALYNDGHRKYLREVLKIMGHEAHFILVKTPPFRQWAHQLMNRKWGIAWVAYALFNRPFFQPPTHPVLNGTPFTL